ncbi:MAG: hypothetical protein IPK84_01800 [Candidatus Moraniibacteriota bacterium]|nr:MAG: hypothetical protein IPK84_01800 [Candidatus Moranbacteria bacterium]
MSKIVEVTVIRHGFRDADGVFHRRRIEVRQLTINDGSRVVITPVDFGSISHQWSDRTCKGRYLPSRSTNSVVRVGQRG